MVTGRIPPPQIPGDDWYAQLQRTSIAAAESRFYGRHQPTLSVDLVDKPALGALDTATVTQAIQGATARLRMVMTTPERTRVTSEMLQEARLIPLRQVGAVMVFGFADSHRPGPNDLISQPLESATEAAARVLIELLPSTSEDDTALDAVLAQDVGVRTAVDQVVQAVKDVHAGLHMKLVDETTIEGLLTHAQADVLGDSLQEIDRVTTTETVEGNLDGLRTQRRIFYLLEGSGREIHGGITPDPSLMEAVRKYVGQDVRATLEKEILVNKAGRRRQPSYRLVSLSPVTALFDD